jgi:hypothetical protein
MFISSLVGQYGHLRPKARLLGGSLANLGSSLSNRHGITTFAEFTAVN